MNIPVILYNKQRADDAFAVHRALLIAEQIQPELAKNPQWEILRQDAYERFNEAFEVRQ